MPNSDYSRDATDRRKHYRSVLMQQGRVPLDDDWNEAERLDAEDARRVRAAVIGPAGSPDNGFKLYTKGSPAELWMTHGSYYVGGLRLELEEDEAFNEQKDWLQQGEGTDETLPLPPSENGEGYGLVWLDVWQQPVSAVEDKELFEVAFGGADTSTRIRTMRRARIYSLSGRVDCADAWKKLLGSLRGEGELNSEFELKPKAFLKVEPDKTTTTEDLGSPPVAGGYLGAVNQAIRVQIVGKNESNNMHQFTWGVVNGAPLYRVKLLVDGSGNLAKIHMLTVPEDQAHYPLKGQVVELLPWSALLPNGQKIAELSGFLTKVEVGYNPDNQDLYIRRVPSANFGQSWKRGLDVIDDEDPVGGGGYFYMRVWNRGADTESPVKIDFKPGDAISLAKTGLQVTFSGENFRKNDFWIIAVRPETPNKFVPWELSTGRPPHGVRRWIAPVGIIHWDAHGHLHVIGDCRPTFLPLTKIRGRCSQV